MPIYPRNLGGGSGGGTSGGTGNADIGALLRQDGSSNQGLFISDKTGQADVSWHMRGERREAAEASVAASARFTGTGSNNYITTSFYDAGDTTEKRFTPVQGAVYQNRIDDPETINSTYSFNYVEYPNPEPAIPDVKAFFDYNDLRVSSTAIGTAGNDDLVAVALGTEPRTVLNAIADIQLVRGVTPGINPMIRVRAPDLDVPASGSLGNITYTFHEGGTSGNGFTIQFRHAVDTSLSNVEITAAYDSDTQLTILVVSPNTAQYTLDWGDVVAPVNAARRNGEQLITAAATGTVGTHTYTPSGTRLVPHIITPNLILSGGQAEGGTATRTGGVTVVHSDTRVRTVGAQAEATIDGKLVVKYEEGTAGNGQTVQFTSQSGSTAGAVDTDPFESSGIRIRVRTGASPTYPITVTPTVGDLIDAVNNWNDLFGADDPWTAELAGGASRSDTISITFPSDAATVGLAGNTLAGGADEVNENPLSAVWDNLAHTLTITALDTDTANEVITAITALDKFQAGSGQTPGDVFLNNALGGDTIVVGANVGDTLTDRFTGGRNARSRSTLVVTSSANSGAGNQMSISGLIQADTVQDIIDAYSGSDFTLSSVSGDATTTFTGATALSTTSLAGGTDAVAAVDRNLPWIYVEAIDDSNVWYDIWYHGPGSDANQRSTLAELRDAWTNISTVNGLAPNPPITTLTGSGTTRISTVPSAPSGGSNYVPASPIEALVRPNDQVNGPNIEIRYDETTDTINDIADALELQGLVDLIETYGTDPTASPEDTPFIRSMFAGGGGGTGNPANITINEGSGSVEVRSSSGTNDSIAPATTSRAGVMLPEDRDQLNALPDQWSATHTYATGDQAALSEKIYISQRNSNTGNNPSSDSGTNWLVIGTGSGSGGTTVTSLEDLPVPIWASGSDYDQNTLVIGPDDELYRVLADISGSTTVPASNKETFERVDGYDGDYADNTAYKRGRIVTHSNNPYFVNAAVPDTNTDDPTASSSFIQLNATGSGSSGLATVATDATISGDGTTGDPLMVANEFTADDESHLDSLPPEYDATTTYSIGDQVSLSGKIYASQVNTNLNNDPSSDDGSNWAVLGTGSGSGGTTVVANPSGDGSADLTKIDIGGTVYDIPAGGTSADGIFRFENIGSQNVNITTANQWTDTGIDIPNSVADGETWAIRVDANLSFDPTWKLIPATSIINLTNAVIGETWDADATSTSSAAQRDRGLQIDFPWGDRPNVSTGRYTMAFGRDSSGNILISSEATAFDPTPLTIAKVVGASGSGSGGGSGLSTVATDATIGGDGTSGDPLTVVNPFTDDDEAKLDAVPAEWDSSTTYSDEDQVILTGKLYISQADSNTNNNPGTDDGTNWLPAGQAASTSSGGLSAVLTDTTLTGDGSDTTSRLSVANPFTDADETVLDDTTIDVVLAWSASAQHTVADGVVYGDTVVITYGTSTYDAEVLTANRDDHIVTLVLAPGAPWPAILAEANSTVSKGGTQFLSWITASLQTDRDDVSSSGQFWYADGIAGAGDETWREIKRVDDFDDTDLGLTARDIDSLTITSSTGNNVELPAVTNALAGLAAAEDKVLLESLPPKWVAGQVYGSGAQRMFGEALYECIVDRAITDMDNPATDTTGWAPVTSRGETALALGTRNDTTLEITSSSGDDVTVPQASVAGGAGVMSGADKGKLDSQVPVWTDTTYSGANIPRVFSGILYETTQEISTATGSDPSADTTNWRQVSVPDLSNYLTGTALTNYRTHTQITSQINTAIGDLVSDKGDYDSTDSYSVHDLVQNDGATYIAIANVAANTAATTEPGEGTSWQTSWKRVGFVDGPDNAFIGVTRDSRDNIIFSRQSGDNPVQFNLGSGALELNELGSENINITQQGQWSAPTNPIDISEIGADDFFAVRWNNGEFDHETHFLHASTIVSGAVAGTGASGTIALHPYARNLMQWESLRLGRTSSDELVVAATDATLDPNPLTIYKFGGDVNHNRTRVERITFQAVADGSGSTEEATPIATDPISVINGEGDPEIISNVSSNDFDVAAGVYLIDFEIEADSQSNAFMTVRILDASDNSILAYSGSPKLTGAGVEHVSERAFLVLDTDTTVTVQLQRLGQNTELPSEWTADFARWGGGREIRTNTQFAPTDLGTTTFDLSGTADTAIALTDSDSNAIVCPADGYIISIMTVTGVGVNGVITWHLASDLRDTDLDSTLNLGLYTNASNELLLSVGDQNEGVNGNRVIIQHLGTTTDTSTGSSVVPSILRFDVSGVRNPPAGDIGETDYTYTLEISQSSHVGSARIIGFPGSVQDPSDSIITVLEPDSDLTTAPNGYDHATGTVEIPDATMIAEDGIYTIRLEVYPEGRTTSDSATIYHDYRIIGGPAVMASGTVHFGWLIEGDADYAAAALSVDFANDISTNATALTDWDVSGIPSGDDYYRLYWAVPDSTSFTQPSNWSVAGFSINNSVDTDGQDRTIDSVDYKIYVTDDAYDSSSNDNLTIVVR